MANEIPKVEDLPLHVVMLKKDVSDLKKDVSDFKEGQKEIQQDQKTMQQDVTKILSTLEGHIIRCDQEFKNVEKHEEQIEGDGGIKGFKTRITELETWVKNRIKFYWLLAATCVTILGKMLYDFLVAP